MLQKVFLYASLREGYKKFARFTYIDRHQTCTEDINVRHCMRNSCTIWTFRSRIYTRDLKEKSLTSATNLFFYFENLSPNFTMARRRSKRQRPVRNTSATAAIQHHFYTMLIQPPIAATI